jgi:putative AdoMet-dependent methyltransferase
LLYGRKRAVLPPLQRIDGLILDVGCGTGFLIKELDKKRTVGLDIKKGFLKIVKNSKGGMLLRGDALSLPLKEGVFGLVCMYDLIHHVKDAEEAISEAKRVLKKGGHLFIKDVKKCRKIEYYINILADFFQMLTYCYSFGNYLSGKEWENVLRDFVTVKFTSFKNEIHFLGRKV